MLRGCGHAGRRGEREGRSQPQPQRERGGEARAGSRAGARSVADIAYSIPWLVVPSSRVRDIGRGSHDRLIIARRAAPPPPPPPSRDKNTSTHTEEATRERRDRDAPPRTSISLRVRSFQRRTSPVRAAATEGAERPSGGGRPGRGEMPAKEGQAAKKITSWHERGIRGSMSSRLMRIACAALVPPSLPSFARVRRAPPPSRDPTGSRRDDDEGSADCSEDWNERGIRR